ncbi:MAG: hypothetical protein ACI9LE_001980, partial [Paraglaciecola sp.]
MLLNFFAAGLNNMSSDLFNHVIPSSAFANQLA